MQNNAKNYKKALTKCILSAKIDICFFIKALERRIVISKMVYRDMSVGARQKPDGYEFTS